MKVYVINMFWDNHEEYEDHCDDTKTIGVAPSLEKAKEIAASHMNKAKEEYFSYDDDYVEERILDKKDRFVKFIEVRNDAVVLCGVETKNEYEAMTLIYYAKEFEL